MALIATLAACEDAFSLFHKDRAARLTMPLIRDTVSPAAYWLVVAVPLLATPLAAAGWALYKSQRGHPARALLTGLAAALAVGSIALDANVLYVRPIAWAYLLEEGMEIMAAALFAVVLAETLGHMPRDTRKSLKKPRGRGAAGPMLTDEDDPVRATMHPPRSFADVEVDGQPRQTRRERFLRRMDALMPWGRLGAGR